MVSTKTTKPVQLQFCVNSERIESVIDPNFITDVNFYNYLRRDALRSYFESKGETWKNVVTIDNPNRPLRTNLRTDITDTDACLRIKNLFVFYKFFVYRHCLAWPRTDSGKLPYIISFWDYDQSLFELVSSPKLNRNIMSCKKIFEVSRLIMSSYLNFFSLQTIEYQQDSPNHVESVQKVPL